MKRILFPIFKGLFVFSLLFIGTTRILAACEGITEGPLKKDGKGVLILGDSLSCTSCYSGDLGEIRSYAGKHASKIAEEVQQMSDAEISNYSAVVVFAGINDLAGSSPQTYEQVKSSLSTIYAKFNGKIPAIGITLYYHSPSPELQNRLSLTNTFIEGNTKYHINLAEIVQGLFSSGSDPIHFGQNGHNTLRKRVREEFAKICGETNALSSQVPTPSEKIVYGFPNTTSTADLGFTANFAKDCQTNEGITCVAVNYIINLLGSVAPTNNILVLPKISHIVDTLTRTNTYLLPIRLQKEEIIPDALPVSATGNTGTENHDDSKQRCYQPKKGVIRSDFPLLNNLLAKTFTLNAYLGLDERNSLNYRNEFPPLSLRDTATRGCIEGDKGYEVREKNEKSIGEHEYDPGTNPFVKAAIKLGSKYDYLNSLIAKLGLAKGESATAPISVITYWHTLCPYCDDIASKFTTNKNGERKESGFATAQLPKSIDLVTANAITNQDVTASIGETTEGKMKLATKDLGGYEIAYNRLGCAYTPASLQKTDCANTPLENIIGSKVTSSWSINGQTSISTTIRNGEYKKHLEDAAREVGIPQCVLEAISFIEGGERMPELERSACLESVNTCSAAGAMQFTTGRGPANDRSCSSCAVKYCPNTWADYGNGGNPCSWRDSLFAAARKLKNDGPLTGTDPNGQGEAIHKAGYHYYGSDNDTLARKRLGGCEYGEYVRKKCDPGYVCRANR